MDLQKMRKMDVQKLQEELKKKQKKLADKKMLYKTGKEKNTSIFLFIRKDIARLKTVLKEKEVLNERSENN